MIEQQQFRHTNHQAEQKPGIEERYAVAVMRGFSSDLILAAGLQKHWTGALLLRLRTEYDAVRGELERAGQIATTAAERLRGVVREADRLKALAARLDASRSSTFGEADEARLRAAALVTEAAAIKLRTPAEVMTARAVILMSLPALQAAKHELAALAVRMGANPKRALAPAVALQLAGRVLDVWLDETCHRCDGTGVLGSRYQGDADRQCPACKGSGHRRDVIGDSVRQAQFAADLMAEIQSQVAAAAAGIKAAIHADSGPSNPMHPELVRRLAELRGAEAAAD